MQFHLNGFRAGDPAISEARDDAGTSPSEVDVLIVGAGPAGLTLAAQLSAFSGLTVRLVEQKDGPIQLGQADGIACRTMEMFNAFGFADRVEKEAYWVNEVTFWRPDPERPETIHRHDRIQDVEDGLSEFPHVILNQARVHDMLLEVMRNAPSRLEPDYSRRLSALEVDEGTASDPVAHPVTATVERIDPGHEGESETIRARYVVGCDGARSRVRKAIGRELRGDTANQAWGVMDVLAVTDFPDIRLKSAIHSSTEGSVLIIPREGGYMVRLYIELDKLNENERVASRNITIDRLIAAAQRILHPYSFEVNEVAWWSVYEIGQRLCDKFDDVPEDDTTGRLPRVFIAGDACHTHSPKAGQGMNVSVRDAFNLGWKLAAVLERRSPAELLHSYSAERQGVAKMLIDFDRELSRMFSARPKTSEDDEEGVDPVEFQKYFQQHLRFTAGTAIRYAPSQLTGTEDHQHLAEGFEIGARFHSAPVIRLADAKPMHLGHCVKADGRWRLFAFADGDGAAEGSRLRALCDFLDRDARSPLRRATPTEADPDSVIDLRAILQTPHREAEVGALPPLLLPRKGRFGLVDYEKVFCPDPKAGDIHAMRAIDREKGCIVIVRPDQHVAQILPLDAHEALAAYFEPLLLPAGAEAPARDLLQRA